MQLLFPFKIHPDFADSSTSESTDPLSIPGPLVISLHKHGMNTAVKEGYIMGPKGLHHQESVVKQIKPFSKERVLLLERTLLQMLKVKSVFTKIEMTINVQNKRWGYIQYTVETPYSTIPYTTIFDITRWIHGPQNLQRPIRTLICYKVFE